MRKAHPARAYVEGMKQRYRKAGKKEKGDMLNEFISVTEYHRKHAMAILSGRHTPKSRPLRRRRKRTYTDEDKRAVWQLAEVFDQIGSKRLRAGMEQELARLRSAGHVAVSAGSFERLKQVSASTLDRLRAEQRVVGRRLSGGTKPGSLLKTQVPIRTFADWNDKQVGFMEIDLVQHDGGNPRGIFACTLHATDVCTGWCEPMAVENKAHARVFEALKHLRARLPFALLGIDSDNGAEFINAALIGYADEERLTFTRGRVGRKNDNAFIEQKNWTIVRRLVGDARFDTPAQVKALNAVYARYRLYINFFLPVTKLIGKERHDQRVRKVYDLPRTPFQRLLDSPGLAPTFKRRLRATYAKLDVVTLKAEIEMLISQLDRL